MDFETILFEAHSGIRWLVVLMTVVGFAWLLVNMLQSKQYTKRTHQIMVIWSSLVGLQWVLGIILFFVRGDYSGYQWEHAITMTIALAVAHLYMPFKKRNDSLRYQAGLGVIIAVGVLVFIGVQRLPQGWGM